ncbi:MAG: DinB family protein [Candidatus Zixiibacteriota bacterium]|nr:MAG: DinB family protein [candidate division Zixibacteria bacterium]
MFVAVSDFLKTWKSHSDRMQKLFDSLTDQSLAQEVVAGHRTLGRLGWHIITTIPEMSGRVGLKLEGPAENTPLPKTAGEIAEGYRAVAGSLARQIENSWSDEALMIEDDMYGEQWKRGLTLRILLNHEIHHAGQMTILMRQAGLKVPGLYGPSQEEWAQYGMEAPEI